MPNDTKSATAGSSVPSGNDPLSKARAARAANKGKNAELSPGAKFAVQQSALAAKVAKLCRQKLIRGESIGSETMRCLGQLATVGGEELFK